MPSKKKNRRRKGKRKDDNGSQPPPEPTETPTVSGISSFDVHISSVLQIGDMGQESIPTETEEENVIHIDLTQDSPENSQSQAETQFPLGTVDNVGFLGSSQAFVQEQPIDLSPRRPKSGMTNSPVEAIPSTSYSFPRKRLIFPSTSKFSENVTSIPSTSQRRVDINVDPQHTLSSENATIQSSNESPKITGKGSRKRSRSNSELHDAPEEEMSSLNIQAGPSTSYYSQSSSESSYGTPSSSRRKYESTSEELDKAEEQMSELNIDVKQSKSTSQSRKSKKDRLRKRNSANDLLDESEEHNTSEIPTSDNSNPHVSPKKRFKMRYSSDIKKSNSDSAINKASEIDKKVVKPPQRIQPFELPSNYGAVHQFSPNSSSEAVRPSVIQSTPSARKRSQSLPANRNTLPNPKYLYCPNISKESISKAYGITSPKKDKNIIASSPTLPVAPDRPSTGNYIRIPRHLHSPSKRLELLDFLRRHNMNLETYSNLFQPIGDRIAQNNFAPVPDISLAPGSRPFGNYLFIQPHSAFPGRPGLRFRLDVTRARMRYQPNCQYYRYHSTYPNGAAKLQREMFARRAALERLETCPRCPSYDLPHSRFTQPNPQRLPITYPSQNNTSIGASINSAHATVYNPNACNQPRPPGRRPNIAPYTTVSPAATPSSGPGTVHPDNSLPQIQINQGVSPQSIPSTAPSTGSAPILSSLLHQNQNDWTKMHFRGNALHTAQMSQGILPEAPPSSINSLINQYASGSNPASIRYRNQAPNPTQFNQQRLPGTIPNYTNPSPTPTTLGSGTSGGTGTVYQDNVWRPSTSSGTETVYQDNAWHQTQFSQQTLPPSSTTPHSTYTIPSATPTNPSPSTSSGTETVYTDNEEIRATFSLEISPEGESISCYTFIMPSSAPTNTSPSISSGTATIYQDNAWHQTQFSQETLPHSLPSTTSYYSIPSSTPTNPSPSTSGETGTVHQDNAWHQTQFSQETLPHSLPSTTPYYSIPSSTPTNPSPSTSGGTGTNQIEFKGEGTSEPGIVYLDIPMTLLDPTLDIPTASTNNALSNNPILRIGMHLDGTSITIQEIAKKIFDFFKDKTLLVTIQVDYQRPERMSPRKCPKTSSQSTPGTSSSNYISNFGASTSSGIRIDGLGWAPTPTTDGAVFKQPYPVSPKISPKKSPMTPSKKKSSPTNPSNQPQFKKPSSAPSSPSTSPKTPAAGTLSPGGFAIAYPNNLKLDNLLECTILAIYKKMQIEAEQATIENLNAPSASPNSNVPSTSQQGAERTPKQHRVQQDHPEDSIEQVADAVREGGAGLWDTVNVSETQGSGEAFLIQSESAEVSAEIMGASSKTEFDQDAENEEGQDPAIDPAVVDSLIQNLEEHIIVHPRESKRSEGEGPANPFSVEQSASPFYFDDKFKFRPVHNVEAVDRDYETTLSDTVAEAGGSNIQPQTSKEGVAGVTIDVEVEETCEISSEED